KRSPRCRACPPRPKGRRPRSASDGEEPSLKNSAEEWLGRVRAFVSEVPGRPDAPLVRRVRRALPLCLPLFLLAAAAIAKAVFWEPALRARHEARFPLFELARQTTALSL